MSLSQLRAYVLANRNDEEAWQEFASRPRPNAIYFDADLPLFEEGMEACLSNLIAVL